MALAFNNCTTLLNIKAAFDNYLDSANAINQPIALTVPANSAPTTWSSGSGAYAVTKIWTDTRTLAATAKTVHELGAYAIAALLALHIAAALHHALILRDGTWSRIWPPVRR